LQSLSKKGPAANLFPPPFFHPIELCSIRSQDSLFFSHYLLTIFLCWMSFALLPFLNFSPPGRQWRPNRLIILLLRFNWGKIFKSWYFFGSLYQGVTSVNRVLFYPYIWILEQAYGILSRCMYSI
jgi:hypothetical protein